MEEGQSQGPAILKRKFQKVGQLAIERFPRFFRVGRFPGQGIPDEGGDQQFPVDLSRQSVMTREPFPNSIAHGRGHGTGRMAQIEREDRNRSQPCIGMVEPPLQPPPRENARSQLGSRGHRPGRFHPGRPRRTGGRQTGGRQPCQHLARPRSPQPTAGKPPPKSLNRSSFWPSTGRLQAHDRMATPPCHFWPWDLVTSPQRDTAPDVGHPTLPPWALGSRPGKGLSSIGFCPPVGLGSIARVVRPATSPSPDFCVCRWDLAHHPG